MDYPYLDTVIYDNFFEMLKGRLKTSADVTAVRFIKNERMTEITYREMIYEIARIFAFYEKNGIAGKHIGIYAENRYEYITVYLATVMKSVFVPLDREMTGENLADCVRNFDVEYLFVTNETKKKLEEEEKRIPGLENVILYNLDEADFCGLYNSGSPGNSASETKNDGKNISSRNNENQSAEENRLIRDFFEGAKDTDKDRFAVLASTSGTDGNMKGVMLTQYNVITNIRGTLENNVLKSPTLAFLPMNHTYGFNPCILATLYNGTTLCLNLKTKYLLRDIRTFNPFFFGAVPMVIEGIYDNIIREVKKRGKEKTFYRTIRFCRFFRRFGIDLRHVFFGKIICPNLRLVVNGGAALNADYVHKFDEIGITILNGYGLTECSPTIAVSRTGNNVPGSAGTIMKNIDVKIAEDGEILVKGPNVMLGYYKNEEATKAAFRDGYFATGDIGYTDGKVIYVTGRKKNLIILENGKNVPPELLESRLNALPYIKESLVVPRKAAARSNILKALLVPAEGEGSTDAEDIREKIKGDIATINSSLPNYMHIDEFEIMTEEFTKNSSKKIIRSRYVENA